jgi:hypothetical protein
MIGSKNEKKSKSEFGSHVRIPSGLFGSDLSGRKSRSGEGVVGHDGWFPFDIINIIRFGHFV